MSNQSVITIYNLLTNKVATVIATLGKRTIILLAISFIIIFTSILLIDNWIRVFNHQTVEIINTRKALNNLHELKFQVAHAESAQRSFLMTGHQKFVASFNNAMSAARQNIAFLESDLEKQPSKDQKAIDLLNTSASKLEVVLAEMQVTIKLAQSGNVKSAIGMLNMDDGIDNMFALNQVINLLTNRYYQNIDEYWVLQEKKDSINYDSFLKSYKNHSTIYFQKDQKFVNWIRYPFNKDSLSNKSLIKFEKEKWYKISHLDREYDLMGKTETFIYIDKQGKFEKFVFIDGKYVHNFKPYPDQ